MQVQYTKVPLPHHLEGRVFSTTVALLSLVQRRLLLVTGKGGVGKTTIAAALARAFANEGKRVLVGEVVPSADTPSQLAVALGGPPPTEEPTLAGPNIWVALLTPSMGHLRFLQDALPVKLLADAAMRSSGLRKFLAAAPGFSDMGVMYRMLDLMKRQRGTTHEFDVCLVDSPATGHALALAQIPDFLTRVLPGGPIRRTAEEGLAVLTDPKVTGTVVVTLPETLPVTEALELEKGLAKYRLPVSAIVVNRVPSNPFSFSERQAVQGVLSRSNGNVFGARELLRIDRAEAALEHLKSKRPFGCIQLAEVAAAGAECSAQLAQLVRGQA
jgi:arsenite/tail-anchored protein-transporting ATPase